MIIEARPAGLGCACNGACDSCKRGMGTIGPDPDQMGLTIFDSIWNALTTTLPIGPNGVPVWILVVAGAFAAVSLAPKSRDFRKY